MIYSKTCEYAIRALLFLAAQPRGQFCLTREVSRETGVPSAYLAKIFRDLVRHGILVSSRGAAGGVALALIPEEISIRKIVEIMEDPEHFQACVMGLDRCSDHNACPLHEVWKNSRKKILIEMERCNLANITKKFGKSKYREMKRSRLSSKLCLSKVSGSALD